MKVFINPGHMPGIDSGAINRSLLLRECDIALSFGELLAKKLRSAGCSVRLLQSCNLCGEEPPAPNICAAANNWPADIFISLHCNSFNTAVRGAETLCCAESSSAGTLARLIQKQLADTLQKFDASFPDRGIKERPDLAVLRCTEMPAVLVETAFIDNDKDAVLLIDRQDAITSAIARGITDYWCLL
ncbi:N-acetylmuramoyl-L-alanine amidase family protein [Pectinatus haikarae]|uniref:N-acetylmuramoyl-L-alanine amidase n=1 Tax=Pectinatus haikarae TaxID=349096 RepID=A0ABT9Y4A9_9FIRM|nr:N-acetylmuramoyl-L-alanine amidase [Pectinatus haikarae]MDQ0202584.1 N-acetylmuramoyl-L-alanine amidase [Pectinatus haikarae]